MSELGTQLGWMGNNDCKEIVSAVPLNDGWMAVAYEDKVIVYHQPGRFRHGHWSNLDTELHLFT